MKEIRNKISKTTICPAVAATQRCIILPYLVKQEQNIVKALNLAVYLYLTDISESVRNVKDSLFRLPRPTTLFLAGFSKFKYTRCKKVTFPDA